MIKKIKDFINSKRKLDFETKKGVMLAILSIHEHCFAYNKKQDIPVWNYTISEDKINLFVFDEDDNTIYDGLVKDAPDFLFNYGDIFHVASFKHIDIPDNIITRENIWLFINQIPNKKRGKDLCMLK